ncbi:MAG: universal stress protein [Syntrophobacteraceae bacterium]
MNSSGRERILVANDGSQHSLKMVEYVSSILDRDRYEVVLYHVVTRVPESFIDYGQKGQTYNYRLINVDEWEEKQARTIDSFMATAKSIFLNAGFAEEAVTVRIEDRQTGIAQDMVAESQMGYRALVLGRKGLSDVKDFMLGSVAERILGLVRLPIWIVGESGPPAKILVCLDGSEESNCTLTHLASVLGPSSSIETTLFHAVRSFHSFRNFMRDVLGSEADMEKVHSDLDQAATMMQPSFDKAKEILISGGVAPEKIRQKIARGISSAAHAIVQEAEEGGYDTILIGRRGLSRVEEFLMGSVSRKVIQMAKRKTVWVVC